MFNEFYYGGKDWNWVKLCIWTSQQGRKDFLLRPVQKRVFYGTSIPACILVFKKNRATSNVLFIDASGKDAEGKLRYRKDKNQNKLDQCHIDDIFRAYTDRVDVERFAHVASFEEIKANEFNLNIPRYVDTFEEEELIDIEEVQGNIGRIKAEIAVVEAQMAQYLKELGL